MVASNTRNGADHHHLGWNRNTDSDSGSNGYLRFVQPHDERPAKHADHACNALGGEAMVQGEVCLQLPQGEGTTQRAELAKEQVDAVLLDLVGE